MFTVSDIISKERWLEGNKVDFSSERTLSILYEIIAHYSMNNSDINCYHRYINTAMESAIKNNLDKFISGIKVKFSYEFSKYIDHLCEYKYELLYMTLSRMIISDSDALLKYLSFVGLKCTSTELHSICALIKQNDQEFLKVFADLISAKFSSMCSDQGINLTYEIISSTKDSVDVEYTVCIE